MENTSGISQKTLKKAIKNKKMRPSKAIGLYGIVDAYVGSCIRVGKLSPRDGLRESWFVSPGVFLVSESRVL